MNSKGFVDNQTNIDTPNDISLSEKPLESKKITSNRVDINVLKSKLQETGKQRVKKECDHSIFSDFRFGSFGSLSFSVRNLQKE